MAQNIERTSANLKDFKVAFLVDINHFGTITSPPKSIPKMSCYLLLYLVLVKYGNDNLYKDKDLHRHRDNIYRDHERMIQLNYINGPS